MDKKKVKELIENAIYQLDPFTMDNSNYDDLCKNATKILEQAKEELNKSDWVSVEDGLPEYEENVLAVNKTYPNSVFVTARCKDVFYDNHNFIIQSMHVTHWKPIEKLEE